MRLRGILPELDSGIDILVLSGILLFSLVYASPVGDFISLSTLVEG